MSFSRDIKVAAHVLAEVTFKAHAAGGRPMMPVGSGYAPYLRSSLVGEDLAVRVNNVPVGADFGQTISVSIELSYYPQQDYGALAEGVAIQLIEGPKIVAEGVCKSGIQ